MTVGDRVIILKDDRACKYLQGHTGILTEINTTINNYRVKLDVPAWNGARGWPRLESIGLYDSMIRKSVLKNKASLQSLKFGSV